MQALEQIFTAYDAKLRRVEQFKYLDRILAMDNNDLPAMLCNLKKARGTWYVVLCLGQGVGARAGGRNVLPGRGSVWTFVWQ